MLDLAVVGPWIRLILYLRNVFLSPPHDVQGKRVDPCRKFLFSLDQGNLFPSVQIFDHHTGKNFLSYNSTHTNIQMDVWWKQGWEKRCVKLGKGFWLEENGLPNSHTRGTNLIRQFPSRVGAWTLRACRLFSTLRWSLFIFILLQMKVIEASEVSVQERTHAAKERKDLRCGSPAPSPPCPHWWRWRDPGNAAAP